MNTLNPILNFRAISAFIGILIRQQELAREMAKREFSERYAGQALGIFWGFAHPIAVILIYVFIFAFVFQARVDSASSDPAPNYAFYLLAGLIPWMAMAETLNKGTQIIIQNSNLVKQVIFPLEILPAKTVIATFFNQMILLTGVLIFALVQSVGPVWTWGLLPALLMLQFMQMLGISMVLSTVGVYLRDLKDIMQVFCMVNIYLMPVVYMPEWLPSSVRWLMYLNPFTYQTLCFQDAICHGALVHPWAWIVFALFSFFALGIGYRVFARLRTTLGNVL